MLSVVRVGAAVFGLHLVIYISPSPLNPFASNSHKKSSRGKMVGWHRATLRAGIYMLNVQDTVSKVDRREMNFENG